MGFVVKKFLTLLMVFGLTTLTPFEGHAHDGVDHGTPEPVLPSSGHTLMAATGSGSSFEGILKYKPFIKGDKVELTLYLVSMESNRPITGATVSGSLSEGDKSTAVAFQSKANGPAGAYAATAIPSSDATMSWLFDVSAGSDSELIAIGGFKSGGAISNNTTASAMHTNSDAPPAIAVIASVGTLLVIGAFAAGRFSARKAVLA